MTHPVSAGIHRAGAGHSPLSFLAGAMARWRDRVVALRRASVFPEHYNRHLIGRAVTTGDVEGGIIAEANYVVFQTRNDGETRICNAGKYVDRFQMTPQGARLKSRTCVYDTLRIATLLATPI